MYHFLAQCRMSKKFIQICVIPCFHFTLSPVTLPLVQHDVHSFMFFAIASLIGPKKWCIWFIWLMSNILHIWHETVYVAHTCVGYPKNIYWQATILQNPISYGSKMHKLLWYTFLFVANMARMIFVELGARLLHFGSPWAANFRMEAILPCPRVPPSRGFRQRAPAKAFDMIIHISGWYFLSVFKDLLELNRPCPSKNGGCVGGRKS